MRDKEQPDGWISIERGIRDHWIYSEKPFGRFQAWIDLILSANFRDKTIMVNGKPFLIRRGSFLTSSRKLAERWGWSRGKVSRFLTVLYDDGMIKTEPHIGTLITIVNYGFYQSQRATKRATNGPRTSQTRDTHGAQENKGITKDNKDNKETGLNDADESEFLTPDEYAKGKGEHGSTV